MKSRQLSKRERSKRLERIVGLAKECLGDENRAVNRLNHANHALGGIAPISALDTEAGARQVETF